VQGLSAARISKFTTDSRTAGEGSFFVPLKGPRFEGHDFIKDARLCGAIGYFKASGRKVPVDGICIEVADPLVALQKLAGETRRRFKGPVVVITGSNGKTTTKEMIGTILKDKSPLLKTEGNLNNHIGLPLTLLNLRNEHRLILLEIGINHPGELRGLCEIARPTIGLITSIGETHLEGLENIEGVAEAKGELLDFLDHGTAVLNRDSPFFQKLKSRQKGKWIGFGLSDDADVRGTDLSIQASGMSFSLVFQEKKYPVHLSVPGTRSGIIPVSFGTTEVRDHRVARRGKGHCGCLQCQSDFDDCVTSDAGGHGKKGEKNDDRRTRRHAGIGIGIPKRSLSFGRDCGKT
ncbi:MAG: UDP-N-acetylmuramoyl-tripeptide--D-alanyl-D-alanine ligase, partial [Nitrospirae bacterium]|nr:UDP-N-acetylmuramoyl-tripeptide--D-alanyl-D-alanine ligase [Nitrospirota bacterium]